MIQDEIIQRESMEPSRRSDSESNSSAGHLPISIADFIQHTNRYVVDSGDYSAETPSGGEWPGEESSHHPS